MFESGIYVPVLLSGQFKYGVIPVARRTARTAESRLNIDRASRGIITWIPAFLPFGKPPE